MIAICQYISFPASIIFLNDESNVPEDLTVSPWEILVMDTGKEEEVAKTSLLRAGPFPSELDFHIVVS